MSKSLGNVLDPFEVMDQLRHRRAALLLLPRGLLRPGRRRLDDHVRRALRVRARQRVGNLASRTLAMIGRYRDGVVPDGRTSTRRSPPTSTACADEVCELLDRAEITQALERIWQRVRRLNRYVEEQRAVAARQGRREGRRARHRRCARSPRACACVTVLLHALHPRDRPAKLLAALGAHATSRSRRARYGARPGGAPVEKLAAAVPEAASDRLPHPPRPRAGARGRARGRGARRRASTRILTIGMDAESLPRRARRRRDATTRCSPRSATTRTRRRATTTRSPPSCASSRAHPRCLAIGETGPRRLPRLRAARRPGARVRGADRARARARQAARHPHPRGRGRHDRHARRARRRASRSSCTASRCPTGSTSASSTAGGSRSPAT